MSAPSFRASRARRALHHCSPSSATVSNPSAISARGNGGAGWLQEAATRKNLELQQQLCQTSTGAPRMLLALASAHRVSLGVLSPASSGHLCRSSACHHSEVAGAWRRAEPAHDSMRERRAACARLQSSSTSCASLRSTPPRSKSGSAKYSPPLSPASSGAVAVSGRRHSGYGRRPAHVVASACMARAGMHACVRRCAAAVFHTQAQRMRVCLCLCLCVCSWMPHARTCSASRTI
jgi:hypothetical protein